MRQNLGRIVAGDCGKLTGLETLLRKNGVLGLGGSTAGSPSIRHENDLIDKKFP